LLGTIVTTLELEGPRGLGAKGPSFEEFASDGRSHFTPQPLSPSAPSTDHCANCTRCIDACPTDAIAPQGYTLDARRCISYLTLEHRGLIPTDLFPGMGNWIAGCDICQEVCPYNKIAERHPLPIHPRYRPRKKMASGLELIDVLSWTADDRAEAFRGSALKRMKLNMVRRNALIAAGNVLLQNEDAELRAAVERCLDDDDDLVRQTAELIVDALPKTQGDSSRKPV
jgi:epoxyqueuosine reductase